MTKIEEIEQKLNECQKALAEIQKEITELNELQIELKESKKEKWKPALREEYWFRNVYGVFDWCKNGDQKIIDWQYNNVPIFKTREECEKYWHFMDTVKEKSYEFSREEWEDWNIYKYFVSYKSDTKDFGVLSNQNYKYLGQIYFKTAKDAQYIIDNFKEELLEYWL